jgi:hypothetical protein
MSICPRATGPNFVWHRTITKCGPKRFLRLALPKVPPPGDNDLARSADRRVGSWDIERNLQGV